MSPVITKKNPPKKNIALDLKMSSADSIDKQIISEQKKEIARLQKLYAKAVVKHESEISKLRAEHAQKIRAAKTFVIPKTATAQEASDAYMKMIRGDGE